MDKDKDSKLYLQITAVIWGIGLVLLLVGLIFRISTLWVGVLGLAGLSLIFALLYATVQTLRHKGKFGKNLVKGLAMVSAELPFSF
ncbi:hypothetical protein RyT2_02780 [Pseudolactococcus yaeyamensis]